MNQRREGSHSLELVLISPPEMRPGEHEVLERLVKGGLRRFHLRKPGAARTEVQEYLARLSPAALGRVVLHEYHDLAAEWPVAGVHFKERDRALGAAIPPGVQGAVSTSCHSLESVRTSHFFSYVFLSPVFESISKPGHGPGFAVKELVAVQEAPRPVYALGGIDRKTLRLVREIGFAGAGVMGAVWSAPDPFEAWHELEEECR